jgi:hypothetical protein
MASLPLEPIQTPKRDWACISSFLGISVGFAILSFLSFSVKQEQDLLYSHLLPTNCTYYPTIVDLPPPNLFSGKPTYTEEQVQVTPCYVNMCYMLSTYVVDGVTRICEPGLKVERPFYTSIPDTATDYYPYVVFFGGIAGIIFLMTICLSC